jgi:hypothetical protein
MQDTIIGQSNKSNKSQFQKSSVLGMVRVFNTVTHISIPERRGMGGGIGGVQYIAHIAYVYCLILFV